MLEQEKMHWAALQSEITAHVFPLAKQIVAHYGSLEDFWHAKDSAYLEGVSATTREKLILMRKTCNPDALWQKCRDKKVGVVCCIEDLFPQELLHFSHSPVILYYYGNPMLLRKPAAAIVGSRKSSAYGRKMAADFSGAFADAGLCVVSGMAKGIDAAAHEGALAAQGDTIAVLGSGVDVPYPPDNRKTYWRIREEGLVVSEFVPGEKPLRWHFPLRNRIISGLSKFVLLVEGEARSGALITCDWAAEQGKDIWALPGPVTNPFSIGPLQLIQDGAQMAITPEDILRGFRLEDEAGWARGADTGKSREASATSETSEISKTSEADNIDEACGGGNGRVGKQQAQRVRETQKKGGPSDVSPRDHGGDSLVSFGQRAFFGAEPALSADGIAPLSQGEKKLLEAIAYYPVHVDFLLSCQKHRDPDTTSFTHGESGGNTSGKLYMDLTKLLALRLIERLPGDYYQRI